MRNRLFGPTSVALRSVVMTLALGACFGPTEVDTGPDTALLFLVHRSRAGTGMEAVYQGPVELDEQGCFRLALEPDRHTVVWPFGHRLARDQASLIVLDERGDEVGRIGHNLRLGGGEVPSVPGESILTSDMAIAAAARCRGRFWITGEVLPTVPR